MGQGYSMLNSIEELEALENDIMLETQQYLRPPYLSVHEMDEVRDTIRRGISECEATVASLAAVALAHFNALKRRRERLERFIRTDPDASMRHFIIDVMPRELAELDAERDVVQGARAFTEELQSALTRLYRRAALFMRKPVRDGFPAPILE